MKILIIGWFFYPKIGGVETVMLQQALYLVSQGYKVSILTSHVDGLPEDDLQNGINIYRRNFIDSSYDQSQEIVKNFASLLTKINPDLVHFHNGSYPAASIDMDAGVRNVCAIFATIKKLNIPVLEHAHNAQLKNPEKTAVLRNLNWDYLIFVSRFVENQWNKLGFKPQKTCVVYNGVDPKQFDSSQEKLNIIDDQNGVVKIFFPSRIISITKPILSKQKNFELVIKACGELLKRGINNFKLIGVLDTKLLKENLPVVNKLKKLINEADIGNYLQFINNLAPLHMPKIYAAVDIVCVPSINESFSLTYLETMASAKIAIGTLTGGTPECIENGQNGFMVSPDDKRELADVLEKLIKNPDLIKLIGKQAREDIKRFFTLAKTHKNISKIYKELLESRRT